MNRPGLLIAFALAACSSASLSAQWVKQPTAGIPRTPDGKPNLTAPAPKTPDGRPDLTGLWQLGIEVGYAANITADLAPRDIQPWAAALSKKRLEDFGKDDPEITGCIPGGPRHITRGGLSKIIQTPSLVVILFEDLSYRQIFVDGRELPRDPNPNWMGYSVGRWEGDTLDRHDRRLQRPDVAGLRRPSAQRRAAHDRALPAARLRSHGPAGHDRRSRGLRQVGDVQRRRQPGGRHRTHRIRVPGERKGSRAPGRPHDGGKGRHGRAGRVLATYVGVYQVQSSSAPGSLRAVPRPSSP